MAFWKNQREQDDDADMPEEFKGKTPKEIAAYIKQASDAAAAAETARKTAETDRDARTAERDAHAAKLAEIETGRQQQQNVEDVDDTPASPWTNPEKFVQDQLKGTNAVALASGLMAAKMYFMQSLTPRDQKIFKKYEGEVEKGVGTFAPAQRVMPQSWLNMFLYVKGLHEADIKKAESDNSDFFSETPSRGASHEEEKDDVLTPEELEVCRVFKYDPKAYLANKKNAVLSQSSKGAYARYSVPTSK